MVAEVRKAVMITGYVPAVCGNCLFAGFVLNVQGVLAQVAGGYRYRVDTLDAVQLHNLSDS